MTQAGLFLFRTLADLFLMLILLRLFLQIFRANFRNPIAQAVLKLTSPVVVPLRRILPALGPVDTATLVVALAFELLFVAVFSRMLGVEYAPLAIVQYAAIRTVLVTLRMFLFAIFISVILSWIAGSGYNPISALLGAVSEPLLAPARRIIPPIAGLDLSPIAVLLLLQATIIAISQALPYGLT